MCKTHRESRDYNIMATPFTLVTAIPEAQRLLIAKGGAIPAPGRLAHGGTIDHVAGRPGLDRRPREDKDDENFDPDGSRKDRHERKPRFKVELLCRTFVGDNGVRPLGDIVFWESPDIVIEGPSGDPDISTPGQVNKVKVHVWNLGLADCWAAHVDLYWCNPSVGVNPGVASPIGSKVVPLAAGQHAIVSFDWIPVVVNQGHECLVAQVYDPVSDPIVAPFNPRQDRHIGQRNVSVVELPAGQTMTFDFFSQNLGLTQANTLVELQKLEGAALDTLAASLGRETWPAAGGREVDLSRPVAVQVRPHPRAGELATGTFRETLQDVPGESETRRVMGVLQSTVAPQKTERQSGGTGGDYVQEDRPKEIEFTEPTPEVGMADQRPADVAGIPLRLAPGRHVRVSLRTTLPQTAERGAADVWRIVEHTAGQITGGVTIVVRAK
jgi:hypothetical protein